MIVHPPKVLEPGHAPLSPSAASRWTECPGSIALARLAPERKSGDAAAVGTVLHAALERHLRSPGRDLLSEEDRKEIDAYGYCPDRAGELLTKAVDRIGSIFTRFSIAEVWLEERVWPLADRADLWGTSDIIALSGSGKTLLVGDLKTGRIKVSARLNIQMLIYALGALRALGARAAGVEYVALAIIQPTGTGAGLEVWETDRETIAEFAAFLSERAALTESLHPVLVPGSHCQYCPASGICETKKQAA